MVTILVAASCKESSARPCPTVCCSWRAVVGADTSDHPEVIEVSTCRCWCDPAGAGSVDNPEGVAAATSPAALPPVSSSWSCSAALCRPVLVVVVPREVVLVSSVVIPSSSPLQLRRPAAALPSAATR